MTKKYDLSDCDESYKAAMEICNTYFGDASAEEIIQFVTVFTGSVFQSIAGKNTKILKELVDWHSKMLLSVPEGATLFDLVPPDVAGKQHH